jgi:DNA replication and repair protein RecF
MSYLTSLKLHNFRSYGQAILQDLPSGLIVLYGANGAGKTNVLEAVSLLTPGRGIRGARNDELQNREAGEPWAIAGTVADNGRTVRLGTGFDQRSDKRVVRIEGQTVRGQVELADYLACVWLTPQMDGLFIDSASARRKFFDRLLFAFDPGHAGRVSRYENVLAQRSKILREAQQKNVAPDRSWLDALEKQIAETGVAIAAARDAFIQRLQKACDQLQHDLFPRAVLRMRGTLEELLLQVSAVEVEEMFLYQLQQSREQDAITGGAVTGPHKSDLLVQYAAKTMPAEQCSTGEQKALLVGIVLAHAHLIAAERGVPPVILLDEVSAHLDESRRGALYALLQALGGQVWLTGTDAGLFDAVRGQAVFYEVGGGEITRENPHNPKV